MRPPMKTLVQALRIACKQWVEVDALPSPPATAAMLRDTDAALAEAVNALREHYPNQLTAS